jgi:uncharacterized membrane protein YbhN (UPF0104 family)
MSRDKIMNLVGVLLLALVAGYLAGAVLRKQPLRVRQWQLHWPSLQLSLAQVAISSVDWLAAASVFHALLPSAAGISFLDGPGCFLCSPRRSV